MAPSTAWPRSASANTTIGPFPPSSSITCLPAARRGRDGRRRHRQRPVPGRDDPVDAAGGVAGERELARAGGWKDAALESLQVLGRDAEVLGRLVDLAQRFREQRLALVERQQVAQLFATLLDRLRDAMHAPPSPQAFHGGHPRPPLLPASHPPPHSIPP